MPLIKHAEPANPVEQLRIWTSPGGAHRRLIIVASAEIYARIHACSVAALPNETAGFLLGKAGFDAGSETWHLTIEDTVPIETSEADRDSFRFTWRSVLQAREMREASGMAILGWYHTHPGKEICLSKADLEKTHRVLFGGLFQVALVYDPLRNLAGYFSWDGFQAISGERAAWREFPLLDRDGDRPSDLESRASGSGHDDKKLTCSGGKEAL